MAKPRPSSNLTGFMECLRLEYVRPSCTAIHLRLSAVSTTYSRAFYVVSDSQTSVRSFDPITIKAIPASTPMPPNILPADCIDRRCSTSAYPGPPMPVAVTKTMPCTARTSYTPSLKAYNTVKLTIRHTKPITFIGCHPNFSATSSTTVLELCAGLCVSGGVSVSRVLSVSPFIRVFFSVCLFSR